MSNHEFEESEHRGFEADGHVAQTVDFNMAEVVLAVDGITESEPEDARVQAGELLAKLFCFIWERPNLKTALIKFSILSASVRPDLVGRSQPELASEIGCSKQALSKSIQHCERTLNIRLPRQRLETSRENMAEAMAASWQRRKAA
jgi:hypothetical protein